MLSLKDHVKYDIALGVKAEFPHALHTGHLTSEGCQGGSGGSFLTIQALGVTVCYTDTKMVK